MTTELSAVYILISSNTVYWYDKFWLKSRLYSSNLVLKSPFGPPSHFENMFKNPFQDLIII